jgi:hypothetical protein
MDGSGRPPARRFIDPWKCARPAAHSPSSVICIDCPRPWAAIPFVAFFMPHHVRTHLRLKKDHRLAFWCDPHRQVEDDSVTSKWDPESYAREDPIFRLMRAAGDSGADMCEAAIEWRRRDIERVEREIRDLEEFAGELRAAEREGA